MIHARPPRPGTTPVSIQHDPDVVSSFLEDAAHFPGGHASGVAAPATEADVAALVASASRVLPVGAQSSLTGGATPMGDLVISLARMNKIISVGATSARVQAGVTLFELDAELRRHGKAYPPVPTFMGASIGGIVSTNAAGAATFRHGTTRDWVEAITVVLADGSVLDVERGRATARDGVFEIALRDRVVRVPVPSYRMPRVPKLSAGYFAAPEMDLVDLFVGSEGTLGIVTEVTLRVLAHRPAVCLAFVPFRDAARALAFVVELRQARAVAAIEHMDGRCLDLLREDGVDRQFGVTIPPDAAIALLVTLELPSGTTAEEAYREIGGFQTLKTPLAAFCRGLDAQGMLDAVDIAVPGDDARAAQLLGVREGVPAAVNARVGRAKQTIDERIAKTAADTIVPFDRLDDFMAIVRDEFDRRQLDGAVWGHISDGNLHPNVIPKSYADVVSGRDAVRAFGQAAIRFGGAPLAEHGVGRNAIKQDLLRELYGEPGIEAMRAVKRSLDPGYKLSPGVIFSERGT